MAKEITSKKGNEISFLLKGDIKLLIGTKPIVVSDDDANILIDRLGGQIMVQDTDKMTDAQKKESASPLTPLVNVSPENTFGKVFQSLPKK